MLQSRAFRSTKRDSRKCGCGHDVPAHGLSKCSAPGCTCAMTEQRMTEIEGFQWQ